MPLDKSVTDVHWTVAEAVTWLAFRVDPVQLPLMTEPDIGEGWFNSEVAMGALRARVAGNPRHWPEPGQRISRPGSPDEPEVQFPAYRVRSLVKRWMRKANLSASDLLAHLEREKQRYAVELEKKNTYQRRINISLGDLNIAAAAGRIVVRGRPWGGREKPSSPPRRQVIPPDDFDEPRRMDLSGEFGIRTDGEGLIWLHDPGPFFYDIQLFADAVRQCWPEAAATCADDVPQRPAQKASKRGPARVDYAAADAPLVEAALRGLNAGTYRTPWDAALASVGEAEGFGKPDSIAKRLVARIKVAQSRSVAEHD